MTLPQKLAALVSLALAPAAISANLTITTPSPLPGGMVGAGYSQTLSATGGTPPYTFIATSSSLLGSPSLPPGFALSANGTLEGTPTSAGTFSFKILATDPGGDTGAATFALIIASPLTITTLPSLPPGVFGAAYSQTINASGGTPPYSFSITVGAAPPGLAMNQAGVLSGTATATGTFSFTAQVADSQKFTATQTFQIAIAKAQQLLQVSPLQLSFSAFTGGDAPPPQIITVLGTGSMASAFSVGTLPNISAPSWLTFTPLSGTTPGVVLVRVNQAGLAAMSYSSQIQILVPGNTTQNAIGVQINLTVSTASPRLQAAPTSLSFAARSQASAMLEQVIVVDNVGGGGSLSFTTSIAGQSSWLGVTPVAGTVAGPSAPALLRVDVNTQGLAAGMYHDVIQIGSSAASVATSVNVPVSLTVADQGAILALNVTGLRFPAVEGNVSSLSQAVGVLNLGDPASTVNWTADVLTGFDWLSVAASTGTASPGSPGVLSLAPNSSIAGFQSGGRYALVRISDPQALNSPQYLVAVLDVEPSASPPVPDPSPAGLYFTASSSAPAAQTVDIYASGTTVQPSPFTNDGANWLTANAGVAITSAQQTHGILSVLVSPAGLNPGIYTGGVNIAIGGVLRTVNVTFVVTSGSCTPSRVALTQTSLANNFNVPAGWPVPLIVQLTDNCGNPVANGSAVATFSNGDPPVALTGDGHSDIYSATWQPGAAATQMAVTISATAPSLLPATAQSIGGVNPNPASPPTLVPGGALHIFFSAATAAQVGAGLAPGNVAQVYGTGLAPAAVPTGAVPLATDFNGTYLLVGNLQAPLFYVSPTLIDAQIPNEIPPNQQYSMVVNNNGALTLPETIDVVPLQPGMAANVDGSVIAQHADYSLVTAANPAKPGEILIIYLAGMGTTSPRIASGYPTPLLLVPVTVQPTITVDGQPANIAYAGLTPTGVGLYQINFTVPANARAGDLNLVVTQGGVTSNTTTLPVAFQ